jgi:hypothetical protein
MSSGTNWHDDTEDDAASAEQFVCDRMRKPFGGRVMRWLNPGRRREAIRCWVSAMQQSGDTKEAEYLARLKYGRHVKGRELAGLDSMCLALREWWLHRTGRKRREA